MTRVRISTFTAGNKSATLAKLLHSCGLTGFEPRLAASGKPYLLAANGVTAGLSITHVRSAAPPFSIMAVCNLAAIGIDAEVWPKGSADAAFLASLAAFEDRPFIAKALATGRNPATLLWVLKEAALKASGEVMINPQHLTVGLSANSQIQVLPSAAATAPLPRTMLRVFELHTIDTQQAIVLAVAIAGIEIMKYEANLDVVCDNPNVRLTTCDWI